MTAAIELQCLTKDYGRVRALDAISLGVEPGRYRHRWRARGGQMLLVALYLLFAGWALLSFQRRDPGVSASFKLRLWPRPEPN